jgi:hypothetical protein
VKSKRLYIIEYRFNGYATAILKLLLDKAREENASVVELRATHSGKPVYEKLASRKRTAPTARKWCCGWFNAGRMAPFIPSSM